MDAILDAGIGLMLMYLILSLVCTAVNEFIVSRLNLRGAKLFDALERLIDDPKLLAAFKDHGLIDTDDKSRREHPSYLSGQKVAGALIGSLDLTKPMPLLVDVQDAVNLLPKSDVRDMLQSAVTAAGNDMDKLRTQIANWFDDAMDRLGGVYKRNLQWITLAVGLGLAVAVNADTFSVANDLYGDSTLRAAVAVQATATVRGSMPAAEFDARLGDLKTLPIGWQRAKSGDCSPCYWLVKALGLLVTAFAISLGAPFWFDMLGKVVNLRGSGARPARSDEAA